MAVNESPVNDMAINAVAVSAVAVSAGAESAGAVSARGAVTQRAERRRAVLLDKDGTLVENVPYNVDPQQIRLAPGAAQALRRWQAAGYVIAVVSNQAGIARGYVSEHDVERAGAALAERVAEAGATLAGFYFCPHDPEGRVERYRAACECRKPAAGLLRGAATDLQLDLERSWMIGDILDDIEAGRRAGCRTVLIDNGNETEWVKGPKRHPHHIVGRLDEAADLVVALDSAGLAPDDGSGLSNVPPDGSGLSNAPHDPPGQSNEPHDPLGQSNEPRAAPAAPAG